MRSFTVDPNSVLFMEGCGEILRLLLVVVLRPVSGSAGCSYPTAFDDVRLREAVTSIVELMMPVIAVCKLSKFRVERGESSCAEEAERKTSEGVFMAMEVLVPKQLFRRL